MTGLVQVYTGEGKGKTTAALGLALRAAGWGKKVSIVQFIKAAKSGEYQALKKLPQIKIYQFSQSQKIIKKPTKQDKITATKALDCATQIIKEGKCDLAILDEINVALHLKLIRTADVLNLISLKPKNIEIILTGRHAPKEIIKVADLVTEMKKIKHPFDKGIKARKGIEY